MKNLVLLAGTIFILFACNNEVPQPISYVSFQVVNDKSYRFTNATWFPLGDKTWIHAVDETDNTQIRLFLPLEVSVGVYPIDSTQIIRAIYSPQSSSSYVADSGSIEVTFFDRSQNRIEGNFHFSATLSGPLPFRTTIEQGKFSAGY